MASIWNDFTTWMLATIYRLRIIRYLCILFVLFIIAFMILIVIKIVNDSILFPDAPNLNADSAAVAYCLNLGTSEYNMLMVALYLTAVISSILFIAGVISCILILTQSPKAKTSESTEKFTLISTDIWILIPTTICSALASGTSIYLIILQHTAAAGELVNEFPLIRGQLIMPIAGECPGTMVGGNCSMDLLIWGPRSQSNTITSPFKEGTALFSKVSSASKCPAPHIWIPDRAGTGYCLLNSMNALFGKSSSTPINMVSVIQSAPLSSNVSIPLSIDSRLNSAGRMDANTRMFSNVHAITMDSSKLERASGDLANSFPSNTPSILLTNTTKTFYCKPLTLLDTRHTTYKIILIAGFLAGIIIQLYVFYKLIQLGGDVGKRAYITYLQSEKTRISSKTQLGKSIHSEESGVRTAEDEWIQSKELYYTHPPPDSSNPPKSPPSIGVPLFRSPSSPSSPPS